MSLSPGALLLALSVSASTPASVPDASGPARLVFLLEYIGTDYAGAVRDGRVSSQSEYGELLRFTRELSGAYAASGAPADGVAAGLAELERLIVARAPAEQVFSKTRELLPLLARALGSTSRPTLPPDLESGRSLWNRDCTPCHGSSGAGDGRAASDMEPKPTSFREGLLNELSPRQAYGAISLGIEGTAMPSFGEAYTRSQIWDVAFFLLTLRPGFAPARPASELPFEPEDLTALSNAELLAKWRKRRPDASPGEIDYLRAHFEPTGPDAAADSSLALALKIQDAFAAVAERVFPGVVGISGYASDPSFTPEKLRSERGDGWIAANPDALRYPGFRPARTGSGFLVDAEGYVLCSERVVRDDRNEVVPVLDVELEDGTHLEASLVGAEPTLGLAVVRIAEPKRLPESAKPLPLGDSDRLRSGHWLIGLADPPGPEKTFAVGVVSAPPARQCYQEDLGATLVQSSLAFPARGAGGPIVDITGRVVGIGVERGSGTPSLGILPINLALNLFEALKVAQSRRSPWIGISVLEIPLVRRRLGAGARSIVFPSNGVYIDDVFDPSPAAKAGVRPGDFLLGIGGHKLLSVSDFQKWLYISGVGATVELELQREGSPLRLHVPIEPRPENATPR